MKRLILTVALFVTTLSSSGHAEPLSQKTSTEQLVNSVAIAYEKEELGALDAQHPYVGKIAIMIKHSLRPGSDTSDGKAFNSLAAGERWLKSKARRTGPYRTVKPLLGCQKDLCTFNFKDGILHNHLYLKEIRYGMTKSDLPYIKSILLLDGD
jgi:hypothetical protein